MRGNFNFSISGKGDDVKRNSLKQLILDTKYPFWKCDMRPSPRHFGSLIINKTLTGNSTLLSFGHGYTYKPSFITAWYYPAGDSNTGSTYGIGDLEILDTEAFTIQIYATKQDFIVKTQNISIPHVVYAELRFYIFAEDFPEYTKLPIELPRLL